MTDMTTIISVLIGGGILGFIQFLITRKDNRNDKENDILSAIKTLSGRVEKIEASLDERDAVLARTHILRFNDDLYNNIHHSEEYFLQTIDDAKTYELYCKKNPEFSNGRTEIAMKHVREEYDRLYKAHKL